ncbi:MAG TPA: replicative DNA helicase [Candidatus Avirikenella pullistercoris]|nr:replicative DNA helicase [Candidatus Avirikenella pullistercoris]
MAKKNNNFNSTNEIVASLSKEGGYIPPQNVELEEAVLGAIMIENNAIFSVQEILKPEAFYKESHQLIFQAALDLSAKHEPIDLYTVGEMLRRKNQLQQVGGPLYLASLTQKVGSAAHIEFHSKIIVQKFIQRELIRASSDIQKNSFDDSIDVTDLIDYAEGEIFKVSEGYIKRDVQKSYDVIRKALKLIEEAKDKPDGLSGVPSGFNDLDQITLGWQPSDLIIIAARPAMGKTAFVLSLARNISVDFNRGVAFFSLEMSAEQLITRLIVSESGFDSRTIKSGKLNSEQWAHLEKSIVPLQNAPLYIDDTPALSIFEFRSKARRLKVQYDIQLIIIDYLQLMTGPNETKGNREQEVSAISRSLKAIAKELNIPIIALSQLNRSVETRGGNKRPQLSDLRESGAIEQDADIVAFIHRPEYYGLTHDESGIPIVPGTAEIIIAKHRNGATDIINLKFRAEQARFTNFDEIPDMEGITGGQYKDFDSDSFASNSLSSASFNLGGTFENNNDNPPF